MYTEIGFMVFWTLGWLYIIINDITPVPAKPFERIEPLPIDWDKV